MSVWLVVKLVDRLFGWLVVLLHDYFVVWFLFWWFAVWVVGWTLFSTQNGGLISFEIILPSKISYLIKYQNERIIISICSRSLYTWQFLWILDNFRRIWARERARNLFYLKSLKILKTLDLFQRAFFDALENLLVWNMHRTSHLENNMCISFSFKWKKKSLK